MENTKACPYCGEEIMLTAKKCKHCGEWLEKEIVPEQKVVASPKKHSRYEVNTTLVKGVYYLAILFLFVDLAHSFVELFGDFSPTFGSGKTKIYTFVLGVFSIVPVWVSDLTTSLLWSILFYFLYKLQSSLKSGSGNMLLVLIAVELSIGVIGAILEFTSEWSSSYDLLAVISLVLAIVYLVVMVISGYKLSKMPKNSGLSNLGTCFYVFVGGSILTLVLYAIIDLESDWYLVVPLVGLGVSYFFLSGIKDALTEKE